MSADDPLNLARNLHVLTATLPRLGHVPRGDQLPANSIYLFFERGEVVPIGDHAIDRIVRVGTHTADGRFPRRIRDHYRGDRRASVFRYLVGSALLHRADPGTSRLITWAYGEGSMVRDIEADVDATLAETFTFASISVDRREDRLAFERGLIALLAQHPAAPPSPTWLGRFAGHPAIRRGGLWNTQQTGADPLTPEGFDRLVRLSNVP